MRILIISLVLVLVAALCALDIRCSMEKDRGRPTTVARVRSEMGAAAKAQEEDRVQSLERQIRGLRVKVRKLNAEGRKVEARQLTSEIIRLSEAVEQARRVQ